MRQLNSSGCRVVLSGLACAVILAGCHKFAALDPPFEPNHYDKVKITLDDGERLTLKFAQVTRDSVTGRHQARTSLGEPDGLKSVGFALDRVTNLAVEESDTMATVGLAVGIYLGLAALFAVTY